VRTAVTSGLLVLLPVFDSFDVATLGVFVTLGTAAVATLTVSVRARLPAGAMGPGLVQVTA